MFLSVALINSAHAEAISLQKKISELKRKHHKNSVALAVREKEYLELIGSNESPMVKGEIFSAVAQMYAQNLAANTSNVVQYCEEALECPLDAVKSAQFHIYVGNVREIEFRHARDNKGDRSKRQAVASYLKGLGVVMKNLKVKSLKHLVTEVGQPRVDMVTVPDNDPSYEELKKRHDGQVAAFDYAMKQHKLLQLRDTCAQRIESFYSGTRQESKEFKTLIHDTIPSAESVQRITETLRKYSAKTGSDRRKRGQAKTGSDRENRK